MQMRSALVLKKYIGIAAANKLETALSWKSLCQKNSGPCFGKILEE